jgi:hypothetical protein
MSRFRIAPALALLGVLTLAACSAGAGAPASPSTPPVPTVAPSLAPPDASPPPATPAPTRVPEVTPLPATPTPAPRAFTEEEKNFLAGVQRGTKDCRPVDGDDLPENAVLGIECDGTDPAVDRVGFYQFENDQDMIDAYKARMEAEGVALDSGTCQEGESEHAYFPGEEEILARAGCFVNDEGFANYRYTIAGDHVYVGILGNSADMTALETFAWLGSEDIPGMPTLWFGGID